LGSINRLCQPGHKFENLFKKITTAKRAGGMAQVVECPPCKCEALSSNSSTEKERERARERKKEGKKGIVTEKSSRSETPGTGGRAGELLLLGVMKSFGNRYCTIL
jgi:hypothetical protein